jgi:hypothetical protein
MPFELIEPQRSDLRATEQEMETWTPGVLWAAYEDAERAVEEATVREGEARRVVCQIERVLGRWQRGSR